jgi:excisionase family DNA binding protein
VRITIEIEDEDVRRVLAPLVQQAPAAQLQPLTRLLKVNEVADRLGVSRNKVYELLYKGEIQSLTIGRTRRVSPVALAEFIARPNENAFDTDTQLRQAFGRSSSRAKTAAPKPTPAPLPKPSTARRSGSKPAEAIDLSPRPVPPSSGFGMSEGELAEALASMLEKGWPADVIEQIRADHKEGVHRVNVLTINDAARYLGLSRYGVERLIKAGKLRLVTIAPTYRTEKPAMRIPAKDVVALK